MKDRFGKEQELVDLHYVQMINLQSATTRTSSRRSLLDDVEKHLRCLEVLKQNVEQDAVEAMITAKLPEEVLVQLEILNVAKNKWTIEKLFERNCRLHNCS